MRGWVQNAYSIIILNDNCGCGVECQFWNVQGPPLHSGDSILTVDYTFNYICLIHICRCPLWTSIIIAKLE